MSTATYIPASAATEPQPDTTTPRRPHFCNTALKAALSDFHAAHRRAEDTGEEYWREEAQHFWERLLDLAAPAGVQDRPRIVNAWVEKEYGDDAGLWYEPHAWYGQTFQTVTPNTEPTDWSRGRDAA